MKVTTLKEPRFRGWQGLRGCELPRCYSFITPFNNQTLRVSEIPAGELWIVKGNKDRWSGNKSEWVKKQETLSRKANHYLPCSTGSAAWTYPIWRDDRRNIYSHDPLEMVANQMVKSQWWPNSGNSCLTKMVYRFKSVIWRHWGHKMLIKTPNGLTSKLALIHYSLFTTDEHKISWNNTQNLRPLNKCWRSLSQDYSMET